MTATVPILSPKWHPLRWHDEQQRLLRALRSTDPADRFTVTYAGRRSGKTDPHLRAFVEDALEGPYRTGLTDYTQLLGAPTNGQARDMLWLPLLRLVPMQMVHRVNKTDHSIEWVTGTRTLIRSMEAPERSEGFPIDRLGLDEYANMKSDVWEAHLRPSLSTPGRVPGRAHFFGTPDGRNHFYTLVNDAREKEGWRVFHWISADILDPEEIEAARADMDPMTFEQEYEATFASATGRVHYAFDIARHVTSRIKYDPNRRLDFCFDFNVDPGSAVVVQPQQQHGGYRFDGVSEQFDAVLDDVGIRQGSTTALVCQELADKFGHHEGEVHIHGDPAGGSRSTQNASGGGDWTIVRDELRPTFGDRLRERYGRAAPAIKDRVNTMNARLLTANGQIRMLFHPDAKNAIHSVDNTTWKKGSTFDIDKGGPGNPDLTTHWGEALGYRAWELYGEVGSARVYQDAI